MKEKPYHHVRRILGIILYNHLKLRDLEGFPKGLDLENCELTRITPEHAFFSAGGDWQQSINLSVGLKNGKLVVTSIYENNEPQNKREMNAILKMIYENKGIVPRFQKSILVIYPSSMEELISNNKEETTLKTRKDFSTEEDYRQYAKEQIEKRAMSFDQEKDTWYGNVPLDVIRSVFLQNGINKTIDESEELKENVGGEWGMRIQDKVDINIVIHEIGHIAEERWGGIAAELSYSPDLYGLQDEHEAFAENFKYYILYPDLSRYYLPEVFMYLSKCEYEDSRYFNAAREILDQSLAVRGKSSKVIGP
jgi:hypothetical protein